MFGLDDWLVHFSDGTTLVIVVVVAILLGLRHASDPDHLAAVTTLVANGRGGATRLGLTWGLGHASSLVVLGVPIVLWKAYLPDRVEQSAEVTIGFVIVALALWLLVRWRRGAFAHGHAHLRVPPRRTPVQAYGIGLVHGIGGSGGVGVLLLAAIHSHAVALVALVLFADAPRSRWRSSRPASATSWAGRGFSARSDGSCRRSVPSASASASGTCWAR